jgi:hypothetical protein
MAKSSARSEIYSKQHAVYTSLVEESKEADGSYWILQS